MSHIFNDRFSTTCHYFCKLLWLCNNFVRKSMRKVCLGPTITCSIFLPINIWKLHNNITPGNIYSCNNNIETLQTQVWYLPYGACKGETRFFLREKEVETKRGQKQNKEDDRTAAEKNRQRNQGEWKQTNWWYKNLLSKISTWSLFQGWKEGGFSCSSPEFKGCQDQYTEEEKIPQMVWYSDKVFTKPHHISQTHSKVLF